MPSTKPLSHFSCSPKVIIIDNDLTSQQILLFNIEKSFPKGKVAGTTSNFYSGLNLLRRTKPDILFLSLDLEDRNGFDLFSFIKSKISYTVFLSAKPDNALKAFQWNADDFLLKPIGPEDLVRVFNKYHKHHEQKFSSSNGIGKNTVDLSANKKAKICIKNSDGIYLISFEDIILIKSFKNYCTFFTKKDESITVSKSIAYYEKLLTPFGFFRIHQSHLINLTHLHKWDTEDRLILTNQMEVPVSIRKKECLKSILVKNQNNRSHTTDPCKIPFEVIYEIFSKRVIKNFIYQTSIPNFLVQGKQTLGPKI